MMTYEEELKMRRNALLESSSAPVLLDDGAATLQLRKRSAEDGEGCYPRQYLVLGAQDVKLLLAAVKDMFAEEWADFLTCGNAGVVRRTPLGDKSPIDLSPQVTAEEVRECVEIREMTYWGTCKGTAVEGSDGEKGPTPEEVEKKIRFREWL